MISQILQIASFSLFFIASFISAIFTTILCYKLELGQYSVNWFSDLDNPTKQFCFLLLSYWVITYFVTNLLTVASIILIDHVSIEMSVILSFNYIYY